MKTIYKLLLLSSLALGSFANADDDRVGNPSGELAFLDGELPGTNNFHRLLSAYEQGSVPNKNRLKGQWQLMIFYGVKLNDVYKDGSFSYSTFGDSDGLVDLRGESIIMSNLHANQRFFFISSRGITDEGQLIDENGLSQNIIFHQYQNSRGEDVFIGIDRITETDSEGNVLCDRFNRGDKGLFGTRVPIEGVCEIYYLHKKLYGP